MGKVRIEKRTDLKPKPTDETQLGFGKIFTDYMLRIDYNPEEGWHDTRIIPYGPIALEPSASCLHYGQLIFEGMKAYKNKDGKVTMFRPEENIRRLNKSARRLCMPELNEEETLNALTELIRLEQDWIPSGESSSLYIRPFVYATEGFLGVKPSSTYTLLVILSPVGSYYTGGLAPTKIYVEDEYVRAVRGGIGESKCAGNYAASLLSQVKAQEAGYNQVLWLDGVNRKFIEEVGTSNAFFVIDGTVVTPKLNGSILPGITRDSTIDWLKHNNFPMEERDITIDELIEAYENGKIDEAFATGTAAVVSPIGELRYKDRVMVFNNNEIGEIAQKVYDGITGIQKAKQEDPFGWVYYVD